MHCAAISWDAFGLWAPKIHVPVLAESINKTNGPKDHFGPFPRQKPEIFLVFFWEQTIYQSLLQGLFRPYLFYRKRQQEKKASMLPASHVLQLGTGSCVPK
jgi:hypothetical protein